MIFKYKTEYYHMIRANKAVIYINYHIVNIFHNFYIFIQEMNPSSTTYEGRYASFPLALLTAASTYLKTEKNSSQ